MKIKKHLKTYTFFDETMTDRVKTNSDKGFNRHRFVITLSSKINDDKNSSQMIRFDIETKINCETALNFSVLRTLEKLGHFPERTSEKEAWVPEPLKVRNPSLF